MLPVRLMVKVMVTSGRPLPWKSVTRPVTTVVGGGITVKGDELTPLPPGVLTVIGPVVLPFGTVATISVVELSMKLALTPLKSTAEGLIKFVPVIVTLLPANPLVGVKLVIVGTVLDEPLTANDCEILKKILPAPSTFTRAPPLGVPGIVTSSDPSFGVLFAKTIGNVEPPSVERLILTFAQLTGALLVFATAHVTSCVEPVGQLLDEIG
jgi:hypothetical protein